MSTSGPPGGSDNAKDVDRRRSLGKYVKRMSSVFRKEKPAKTSSTPSTAGAAGPSTTPAPKAEEKKASAPTAAVAATPPTAPGVTTQQLNRSALQQERARALFAKYGLTLETHEWITAASQPTDVQRIEKPIRMRVHRQCHHCQATFGPDKVCAKCEHKRCKKCPRYPKKRLPGEKTKGKTKEADGTEKPKRKKQLLTVQSKTGGELAYRRPTQRIRRMCHKCDTYFVPATATICENCRHVRCTKCPRDPAKLGKWPHGYPGDVQDVEAVDLQMELQKIQRIWRKPRVRVKWECEECKACFIHGNPNCPGCGHQRCEKCTRQPLKKTRKEPEFDPEIVKAVEAKLKALAVDSSGRAATGTQTTT